MTLVGPAAWNSQPSHLHCNDNDVF